MTPVIKCGIEEEFPLFLTGMAYGAGLVVLLIVLPLVLYVYSLRKKLRKARTEAFAEGEAFQERTKYLGGGK